LREAIWRYFRLDDDLEAIHKELGVDPVMAQALESFRGLRLLRQEPWECLACFICSVDSNIPRIIGTVERLAQTFGEPIGAAQEIAYAFPTPQAVAEAGEAALRRLGLGFRAPYLWRTARMIAEGEVALAGLRSLPYAEAKRALVTLPGVGEKVADCVLAFSLDKLEAFPIDRWVRRALIEEYLGGHRWTDRALREWAQERFGVLGAYAQQYLFQWKRGQGA
jgi:N-glycosylase/DNA lyase